MLAAHRYAVSLSLPIIGFRVAALVGSASQAIQIARTAETLLRAQWEQHRDSFPSLSGYVPSAKAWDRLTGHVLYPTKLATSPTQRP